MFRCYQQSGQLWNHEPFWYCSIPPCGALELFWTNAWQNSCALKAVLGTVRVHNVVLDAFIWGADSPYTGAPEVFWGTGLLLCCGAWGPTDHYLFSTLLPLLATKSRMCFCAWPLSSHFPTASALGVILG